MGQFVSKYFDDTHGLVLIGLDNAGKSTLFQRITKADTKPTLPTQEFQVDRAMVENRSYCAWDLGGQAMRIPLWKHYLNNVSMVLFMVDIMDKDRWGQAIDELLKICIPDNNFPIIILANKIDRLDDAAVPDASATFLNFCQGQLQTEAYRREIIVIFISALEGINLHRVYKTMAYLCYKNKTSVGLSFLYTLCGMRTNDRPRNTYPIQRKFEV